MQVKWESDIFRYIFETMYLQIDNESVINFAII